MVMVQVGSQLHRMGDEEINDAIGGAAHCEEPSIVGILTTDVLEARCSCCVYVCSLVSLLGCIRRPNLWQPPHSTEDPSCPCSSTSCSVPGQCQACNCEGVFRLLSSRPEPDPSKPKVELEHLHFGGKPFFLSLNGMSSKWPGRQKKRRKSSKRFPELSDQGASANSTGCVSEHVGVE